MAVAGYTKDRIKVEQESNILIISGVPAEESTKEVIRQRSISNSKWVRTFELAAHVEVADVQLKDGILTVYVTSTKPAAPPRTAFEIK